MQYGGRLARLERASGQQCEVGCTKCGLLRFWNLDEDPCDRDPMDLVDLLQRLNENREVEA